MIIENGNTSNGYATKQTILTIAACARGGYCAFVDNIIIANKRKKRAVEKCTDRIKQENTDIPV